MSSLNIKDTVSNLVKKGFYERPGGKHRALNYVTLDGKRSSITTHVSRGSGYKTLPDNLISPMAKQCGLAKKDFIKFASCTISQEEYELMMKQAGRL